jgi:hypothetical protein
MHIRSIGIPTRLLLCVALLMTAVPSGAGAQEEDHAITGFRASPEFRTFLAEVRPFVGRIE